jgi:hypothetical protein
MSLFGWQIVSRIENVRGFCVFSFPLRNDWHFGLILSEDFTEFFLGRFKKGWG